MCVCVCVCLRHHATASQKESWKLHRVHPSKCSDTEVLVDGAFKSKQVKTRHRKHSWVSKRQATIYQVCFRERQRERHSYWICRWEINQQFRSVTHKLHITHIISHFPHIPLSHRHYMPNTQPPRCAFITQNAVLVELTASLCSTYGTAANEACSDENVLVRGCLRTQRAYQALHPHADAPTKPIRYNSRVLQKRTLCVLMSGLSIV